MRKLIGTLAIVSLLAVGAAAAYGATRTVSWKAPSKTTISIKRNDTVRWVWADRKQHNVRGPGLSSAFSKRKGKVVAKKFGSRGTFTYICDVHPRSMKTVVRVK